MPRIPGLGTSRLTPADLKRRAARIKLLVLDVDGVLTDGGMYYGPDGEVMKKFDTRDGQGIVLAMRSGIEVAFLTLEATSFSQARARKLGVRHCIIGSKSKTDDLNALQQQLNVTKEQTAYVGDDLGDVPCISKVGIFFTPANGWISEHGVTVVLDREGGAGAVRQAIQWMLDQRG